MPRTSIGPTDYDDMPGYIGYSRREIKVDECPGELERAVQSAKPERKGGYYDYSREMFGIPSRRQ